MTFQVFLSSYVCCLGIYCKHVVNSEVLVPIRGKDIRRDRSTRHTLFLVERRSLSLDDGRAEVVGFGHFQAVVDLFWTFFIQVVAVRLLWEDKNQSDSDVSLLRFLKTEQNALLWVDPYM